MANELITIEEVGRIARDELDAVFNDIQQPRSDYQLAHFVVGEKDTPAAQYAQCVLEMQVKWDAIRTAQCDLELIEIDIEECDHDRRGKIEARKKRIGLESTNRAMLGAIREFACLYRIFKSFDRAYSYEDIQHDQIEYWFKRGIRQTEHEFLAQGRPGVGQLDMLRQMGMTVAEFTEENGARRRNYELPTTTESKSLE